MFCVVDTERIKGNLIYLFSYQLYDDDFCLIESKTYQDVSIDLEYRKSPKSKTKRLATSSIKLNSFTDIYEVYKNIIKDKVLIVFSKTDVNVIKQNCKNLGLEYNTTLTYDLQKILYDLSESDKKKSNLKDYCKANKIKHNPHIPESDCAATFSVFKNLISNFGWEFVKNYAI